jgi:hypothetical protein
MRGVYGWFKRAACIVVESSGRLNLCKLTIRLHLLRNICHVRV